MGATCAESPVPSVASEELAAGKRWTSLALVMQVGVSTSYTKIIVILHPKIFPTFLVAGLGMVAAGLVLNLVQAWPVFTEASEAIPRLPLKFLDAERRWSQ